MTSHEGIAVQLFCRLCGNNRLTLQSVCEFNDFSKSKYSNFSKATNLGRYMILTI